MWAVPLAKPLVYMPEAAHVWGFDLQGTTNHNTNEIVKEHSKSQTSCISEAAKLAKKACKLVRLTADSRLTSLEKSSKNPG